MNNNNKWPELLQSLKKTLGQITVLNRNSRVTIINFSSRIKVECINAAPNSINVEAITFQCEGTNFEAAFTSSFENIAKISMNDIVLVFMTDGHGHYPVNVIKRFKSYLASSTFTNLKIKFEFNAIGFKTNSSILADLIEDLGGTTHFADSETQLTKTFMEILDKKID